MKYLIISLIRAYQLFVSPLFPPTCRFVPTCSSYTISAIESHGIVRGLGLGLVRILKCHPFHSGGWDPVPPAK
ncbi:MAG: membrane protein insertion efficiency factor YidD [Deltaproteobacteria bacterium]|nr:membrane protein insertion efficiency factor YidD [Deltaproteobacteria bacterium]